MTGFYKECAACKGEGSLPRDQPKESAGVQHHPGPAAHGSSEEGFWTPCDHCHRKSNRDGKVPCTFCLGTGDDPFIEDPAEAQWCPVCDGDKVIACEDCGGEGGTWDSCGRCMESLEEEEDVYIGDGEMYCYHCMDKRGAFACDDCASEGTIPVTELEHGGKKWTLVPSSCSCCGGRPHNFDEPARDGRGTWGYSWFVVKAQLLDTDGVFYSYLCVSEDTRDGCLVEVQKQQEAVKKNQEDKQLKLDTLGPLLATDPDGLETEMTE